MLQAVTAYAIESLPLLLPQAPFVAFSDTQYDAWDTKVVNQRGDVVTYRVPTLFEASENLAVSNIPDFEERRGILAINKELSIPFAITDQDMQTYPLEKLMGMMGAEVMKQVAARVDAQLAKSAAGGFYRFIGGVSGNNTINSIQKLRKEYTKFENFGYAQSSKMVISNTISAEIFNTMVQEFRPQKNDAVMLGSWYKGRVAGMDTLDIGTSTQLPVHTAGTGAGTGVTFTSVSDTMVTIPGSSLAEEGSTIVFTGLKSGDTIIGSNDSNSNGIGDIAEIEGKDLFFLNMASKSVTDIKPQFQVVTGGVADSRGRLSIDVVPRFDSTPGEATQNIWRSFDYTNDRINFVPSHRCGSMWIEGGFKFAAPKLPTTDPYTSAIVQDPDTKISMRMYKGHLITEAESALFHDIRYGSRGVRDYGARVVLPL